MTSTPAILLYAESKGSLLPFVCLSKRCNIILKVFNDNRCKSSWEKVAKFHTGFACLCTGHIIEILHRAGMAFERIDKLNSLAKYTSVERSTTI